MKDNCESA